MAKAAREKELPKYDNTPAGIKERQENHAHYKHYDVFEAVPRLTSFRDDEKNEIIPVILGYELGKKMKTVFVEPTLVNGTQSEPGFNHFALGNDIGSKGGHPQLYLLTSKEYKSGQYLAWDDMKKLFRLTRNHINTKRLAKYREFMAENERETEELNDAQYEN